MKYCPEIAILHSALALIEKQICSTTWTLQEKDKKEKLIKLDKADSHKFVKILHATVDEITKGLEFDNSKETQDLWQKRLYNILLYRLLISKYETKDKQVTEHLYQIDVISQILPDIGISLFVGLVKDCHWFSLFINNLQDIECAVAAKLLTDCVQNISQDPVDVEDVKLGFIIFDWMISKLVTTNENSVDAQQEMSPDHMVGGADQKEHRNISSSVVLTSELVQCFKTLLYFLNKEIKTLIESAENKNEIVKFLQTYSVQILFLGCINFLDYEDICSWGQLNLFGVQVLMPNTTETMKKKEPRYGKFRTSELQSKVLSINYSGANLLQSEFPLDLWEECFTTICNTSSTIGEHFPAGGDLDSRLSLCLTPVLLNTKQNCQSFYTIGCDVRMLANLFVNAFTDTSKSCSITKEYIEANLPEILGFSVPDDGQSWSLPAVLWRVDKRQPGYKACVHKLVTMVDPQIWCKQEVIETLQRNLDVIGCDEVLMYMYQLAIELLNTDCSQTLKQIILDGFTLLDSEVKNKHIVHIYQTYEHWPMSSNGQLEVEVMATLNKLTSDHSEQISNEIFKLAVQNAPLIIDKAVHRMIHSTQQAQIIAHTLRSLHSVCRLDHLQYPGHSLLGHSLHEMLMKVSLTKKEQQSVVCFIQQICTMSAATESTYKHGLTKSALDIDEFMKQTVVPQINVPCLYMCDQPMKTTFTLELAINILSLFMKPKCLLVGETEVKRRVLDSMATVMTCVSELLHECVALWDSQKSENQPSKVLLLENLLQFLQITKELSSEIHYELPDISLHDGMDMLDWSVSLRMMKIYLHQDEYLQVCQDFSSSLFNAYALEEAEHGIVDVLRCASINEELMNSLVNVINNTEVTFSYENLVTSLVQLFPNLVTQEWIRCLDFIQKLFENDTITISYRSSSSRNIPMINLEDIHIQLQLSQCLQDVLVLLPHSSLGSSTGAINHCIKSYVTVLKDKILCRMDLVNHGCAIYLLSEVYHHICTGISWMSHGLSEPINVVLLDITCMFEELYKNLNTKKQKCLYQSLLEAILNDTAEHVLDSECRDMVFKKLQKSDTVDTLS